MGKFTAEESIDLQKSLKFLIDKGYKFENERESLVYKNDNIIIDAYNVHFGDSPGVNIRFVSEHELYQVGWFLFYLEGFKFTTDCKSMVRLQNLISLLKEHYQDFTNIEWCRGAMVVVDKKLDEIVPFRVPRVGENSKKA